MDEQNVLSLVKGRERYVWIYSDDQRADVEQSLGRFAADPELSFSWYDCAVMVVRVRRVGAQIQGRYVTDADIGRPVFYIPSHADWQHHIDAECGVLARLGDEHHVYVDYAGTIKATPVSLLVWADSRRIR